MCKITKIQRTFSIINIICLSVSHNVLVQFYVMLWNGFLSLATLHQVEFPFGVCLPCSQKLISHSVTDSRGRTWHVPKGPDSFVLTHTFYKKGNPGSAKMFVWWNWRWSVWFSLISIVNFFFLFILCKQNMVLYSG